MFSLKLNQIQTLQTAIVQTVLQADYLQLHRYLHSYFTAGIHINSASITSFKVVQK